MQEFQETISKNRLEKNLQGNCCYMKNVILISLDTMRADRLSCYGHFRKTSPHLDKIAAEGVVFTDFFSPHIPTFPGHTTMMTGKDVYAHQITSQSGSPEPAEGVKMIAELLKEQGYFTASADNLGRWFLRGVDHTEDYKWEISQPSAWRKAEAVNNAAIKALTHCADQDSPFFLFLHYWDPHTPYLPPAPFDRMFYAGNEYDPDNDSMDELWDFENFKHYFAEWMPGVTDIEFPKAQYDASIAYLDTCLSHLFAHIDELGLTSDTLLVITADHGEELDEHGCWFDHHGLYDTNLHIPLILHCPGELPAGRRVHGLTQTPDITPTILDFLEFSEIAKREGMTGKSLLPLINDLSKTTRGTTDILHITENTWMKKRGVRTSTWKLIVPLEIPDIHGRSDVELYNLCDDPGELNNLAEARPEVVSELKERMDRHLAKRVEETSLPDPLPLQPIPLHRVGNMEAAIPRDHRAERAAAQKSKAAKDEKLESGDFIGYDREP